MNVHELEKGLNFDSDTFEELRQSASFVLQRLLGNMVEKKVDEGKVAISIDVSFNRQNVPDYSPGAKEGSKRGAIKPFFAHKITSSFQMKDEKKGNIDTEMEMVLDDDTGEFVMRPIIDTEQKSIFDSDYRKFFGMPDDENCVNDDIAGTELPGYGNPQLPGPASGDVPADGEDDDYPYDEPEDDGEE